MAIQVVKESDGFNLPPLGVEDGSSFGWFDRFNIGMDIKGEFVTDYADWEARDLYEMLAKDYKARQMENVLALPLISAERNIVAPKGGQETQQWLESFWEQDHLNGGCKVPLDHIIDQMTSAFSYKRAYFEKVWREGDGDFAGKIVYDTLGWRPQTTCRIMRHPQTGSFMGFQQEAYYVGPEINSKDKWPITIPHNRAFVYTHGVRRDPLNGSSDMEVAYWCWKTKQKLLLLWFQFLQSVSLPRIITKANDIGTARQIAQEIGRMATSGVLPVAVPSGPDSVGIDVLDVSGKGADQFQAVINWLDSAAADSILAGFLNLTGAVNASHFGGSYALSKDASDFYLQSEEAKAREIEYFVRKDLFAPLIRYNFGKKAPVPKLQFEPLNDIDKATAVSLLQAGMAAPPGGPVPVEFIAALAGQVSQYIGLDGPDMQAKFQKSFQAASDAAKQKAEQMGQGPLGQAVAGVAGAVNAAKGVVNGDAPTTPAQQAGAAAMDPATKNALDFFNKQAGVAA